MTSLKISAWLTLCASLLHVGIIAGGAEWYRFFGAGEAMATMSEQGSWYPALVTFMIAMILFVWSLYAFSAAGLIKKLPLLKPALAFIGFVFLMRGLLAIPAIYLLDSPYMADLKVQITLMTVTSVICLVLARGYIKGFLLHR